MKSLPKTLHSDPRKLSAGFTIIEIIIGIFIVVILLSVGQASYREFILKKSLDEAKNRIVSDIRLAQNYAQAGKKSSTCTGLNGYLFSVYSNSNPDLNYYRISADCATDETIKDVYLSSFAKNIRFSANGSILFKILGNGTNIAAGSSVTLNLVQETTNATRTIQISSGGEVK